MQEIHPCFLGNPNTSLPIYLLCYMFYDFLLVSCASDEKIEIRLLESPVMKQHIILCRKLIIIWWGGINNSGHLSHKYLTLKGLNLAVSSFVFYSSTLAKDLTESSAEETWMLAHIRATYSCDKEKTNLPAFKTCFCCSDTCRGIRAQKKQMRIMLPLCLRVMLW
jgi:hypothetical protein